jgi:hypothetical protein
MKKHSTERPVVSFLGIRKVKTEFSVALFAYFFYGIICSNIICLAQQEVLIWLKLYQSNVFKRAQNMKIRLQDVTTFRNLTLLFFLVKNV